MTKTAPHDTQVPSVDKEAPLAIESQGLEEDDSGLEKINKRLYILGIFVFMLIVAGTGSVAYAFYKITSPVEQVLPPPTAQATTAPILEKDKVIFEVLNGSGVTGAAKSAATKLQNLGYKVVRTGNTENTSGASLYLTDSISDRKDLILESIKSEFPDALYAGLMNGSDASARLVIGKNLK